MLPWRKKKKKKHQRMVWLIYKQRVINGKFDILATCIWTNLYLQIGHFRRSRGTERCGLVLILKMNRTFLCNDPKATNLWFRGFQQYLLRFDTPRLKKITKELCYTQQQQLFPTIFQLLHCILSKKSNCLGYRRTRLKKRRNERTPQEYSTLPRRLPARGRLLRPLGDSKPGSELLSPDG